MHTRSMPKIYYEVDPHNRLVVKKTGRKSLLSKYRTCLEGRFKTDEGNSLVFEAKVADKDIAEQLKFKGTWALDKNHKLVFMLNKWGKQIAGNKLVLNGEINSLDGNEISFSMATREAGNKTILYLLRLSGGWKVDKYNNLNFSIERDKEADVLKFFGTWKLKNNLLTYSYATKSLATNKKESHNITLSGYWDIVDKYRLTYMLDKELGSSLTFRTSIGKIIQQGNRHGLKYELGAGLASSNGKSIKEIIIFGKWRLENGIGLVFEVEYENGVKYPINFSATAMLNDKYSLSFKLQNNANENLGIILQLSRKILQNGESFVRFLSSQEERAIQIGLGFRW